MKNTFTWKGPEPALMPRETLIVREWVLGKENRTNSYTKRGEGEAWFAH